MRKLELWESYNVNFGEIGDGYGENVLIKNIKFSLYPHWIETLILKRITYQWFHSRFVPIDTEYLGTVSLYLF